MGMINLSLNELKLIAQVRNISNYEKKIGRGLGKSTQRTRTKTRTKTKTKNNKKKLEEIRKDFYELRHKFSKKEADKYRKAFYIIKNYRHLSISKIKEARKNLNTLTKSLRFKKFRGNIDNYVDNYDDLDNYDDNYDFCC